MRIAHTSQVDEEIEALLADMDQPFSGAEIFDDARRQVLRVLSLGERCSPVDVTVLDELERRGRLARLETRH